MSIKSAEFGFRLEIVLNLAQRVEEKKMIDAHCKPDVAEASTSS